MAMIPDRLSSAAAAALFAAGMLAAPSAPAQAPATPPAAPFIAAPPPPSAPTPAKKTPRPTRESRVDAYIASLHKRLMITAAQESQWEKVADVMRENAKQIDSLASARSAKRAGMTAVDNLRSYEEIADAHAEGLKKLVPAFSALYDTMSDAQKKNADAVFAQQPRRRGRAKSG